MDRERQQLQNAPKITIYVEEEIYLATKRAMEGTDFGLERNSLKNRLILTMTFVISIFTFFESFFQNHLQA